MVILWEVVGFVYNGGIMNKKYEYKIGTIFNKIELIQLYKKDNRLYATTKCIECGKLKDLRASDLYNSKQNSCICQIIKHGLNESKIYSIYHNMKDRCLNKNCHAYENYGGRGITICDDWLNKDNGFSLFYQWAIHNGYEEGLSIDRIQIEGNYKPENCRWITRAENTALSNVQHPRIKKKI